MGSSERRASERDDIFQAQGKGKRHASDPPAPAAAAPTFDKRHLRLVFVLKGPDAHHRPPRHADGTSTRDRRARSIDASIASARVGQTGGSGAGG